MTAEQKKIALVAVAGGGGLLLLWYLLRSGGGGAGAAPEAQQAESQLQLPPGSDITYNFPGMAPPAAAVATPTAPSCTKVCDECDDNSAFANVAFYGISGQALMKQIANVSPFVPAYQPYSILEAYVTQFGGFGLPPGSS